MAVPTTITLTGNYGADAEGFVDIERPMSLLFDSVTYPETHLRVQLVAGAFSVGVPATDDPTVSPLNAYYRITENINGERAQKNIFVPYDSPGGTLDVNTATPVNVVSTLAFAPGENTVGTDELQDGAVTTPKVEDAAITPSKLDRQYLQVAPVPFNGGVADGAVAIDSDDGTIQQFLLEGDSVFTLPLIEAAADITLELTQDGTGGWTATWVNVLWPNGSPPVIYSAADGLSIVSLYTVGGSADWRGFLAGTDVS